jgi:hypothetical protein
MPPSNVSVATSTGGIPRPHPQAPFNPSADQATFRDLLLFEERLKMNAEMLRKRRRRYSGELPFEVPQLMGSVLMDIYWIIDPYGLSLDVYPPFGKLSPPIIGDQS